MSFLIGSLFLALLCVLCGSEWLRFRRARVEAVPSPESMDYPQRRFSRRIGIAGLLAAAIALATFVPRIHPWVDLLLLVFIALLLALAIVRITYDLRESTEEAAIYAREMNRLARASTQELMQRAAEKHNEKAAENRQNDDHPESGQ